MFYIKSHPLSTMTIFEKSYLIDTTHFELLATFKHNLDFYIQQKISSNFNSFKKKKQNKNQIIKSYDLSIF